MALNFPADPALNETYPVNGVIYTWDGVKWTSKGEYSTEIPIIPDENGNVIITGTLTVQGGTITGNVIQGTEASISGPITGASASISGDVSATNTTLSGDLSAANADLSGDITVAGDVIND